MEIIPKGSEVEFTDVYSKALVFWGSSALCRLQYVGILINSVKSMVAKIVKIAVLAAGVSGFMDTAHKTVFISYSRAERRWLKSLKGRLTPLLAGKDIDLWDDSLIKPGEEWEQEIHQVINRSCAAILLVSPRFLASDYIGRNELPAFIDAAKERGMLVLWVPVKTSEYKGSWISTYQWVHPPTRPLAGLRGSARTVALDAISQKITNAIDNQPALPFLPEFETNGVPPFRMFRYLRPGLFEPDDLAALAEEMEIAGNLGWNPGGESDDYAEENKGIPAGYSYLGSFIDHDLTFRQIGSAKAQGQLTAFGGYAPAFNLHTIYGLGPNIQPYFYKHVGHGSGPERDRFKMALGNLIRGSDADPNARDLPRIPGDEGGDVSLVPDVRADDSIPEAQMHAMMLRFHNRLTDIRERAPFYEIQRALRFHYQWVVIHDFLPTLIHEAVLHSVLPHLAKRTNPGQDPPQLRFFRPGLGAGVPIEYEWAVVRIGHSTVRQMYRLNHKEPLVPIFDPSPRLGCSLHGRRACPQGWAIDWDLFFDMRTGSRSGAYGPPQYSAKIDTAVPNPVARFLLFAAKTPGLAYRNLLRGLRMAIPSGQVISEFMGCPPIPDDRLTVGRATERDSPTNKLLVDISPRFRNNAPLWYYVLAEAQQQFENDNTPIRLGPVGGRIFAEVLIGLMLANPASYLRSDPTFQPYPELCASPGRFLMSDLLRAAMQA
jgi:hypothetical protein